MRNVVEKRRVRAPDVTRGKLLQAAFAEIYRNGFQATSIDAILASTGVTKGALYHHFPNKTSLGYAVVDEVVRGLLLEGWLGPLDHPTGDSLAALQQVLRHRAKNLSAQVVELGCPLNNLAQEMSPLDEGFRRRIDAAFATWRRGFAKALKRAQAEGVMRKDISATETATFLVAAIEGSIGLAKTARNARVLHANLEMLAAYVDSLRATP